MGTLEGMNIKMNIGSFSLEEDGFSAVTDEFENPFEKEAERIEQLPAQTEITEVVKPVEAAEGKIGLQAEKAPEKTGTEAPDSEQDPDDKKRAEHEAAEAKRKAEWEARRQAKKDAEKMQMERIMAMGEKELMSESMKRVGIDTEKLTRRNLKECVAEHIQTACLDDAAFARQVMLPQKNMIRCFQYITRKAYEFVQDEMKAAGIQPGQSANGYSSDIPYDLCYYWAVEYFWTMDVKEDKEDEEEFVPKPYVGGTAARPKRKKNAAKKSPATKVAVKKAEKKETDDNGQISFMEQLSLENMLPLEKKAG